MNESLFAMDNAGKNINGYNSVGIDLKELGGQMSKCLQFFPGIEN